MYAISHLGKELLIYICCRGFLKSDKQLGVVNIKLQPLEDRCVYHDSYDVRTLIILSYCMFHVLMPMVYEASTWSFLLCNTMLAWYVLSSSVYVCLSVHHTLVLYQND